MTTPEQRERLSKLCQALPVLADKDGFGKGWDPRLVFPGEPNEHNEYPFPQWANKLPTELDGYGSQAQEAVRFVRHIWNLKNRPPCLAYWDTPHLQAYLKWAADPWWVESSGWRSAPVSQD